MLRATDIIADMHTHTVFSEHAYSTVKENIDAGRVQGLRYIAITDHYLGNGDVIDKKNEINRIKYVAERVNPFESPIIVIPSAEFNLNQEVYTWHKVKDLAWKPVGLHNWFIDVDNTTLDDVFEMFVQAHQKGCNSFNHIERELHKIHNSKYTFEEAMVVLKKIVDYAREHNIWLEANESSIVVNEGGGQTRMFHWLKYAKEKGNRICLGSDAHYCMEVGRFNHVLAMLNELEYPKELILNCDENLLREMFT